MEEEKPVETPTSLTPMLDTAASIADRIEAANKKTEELVARQEAIMARNVLGGRADATDEERPKTQADLDIEAANKLVAGYGLDLSKVPANPDDKSETIKK